MSNTLHIRPIGPNAQGYPEDFPIEVRERQEGEPPEGWFSLMREDYDAYVAALKPAYDAAKAQEPAPEPEERPAPEPTIEERLAALEARVAVLEGGRA